MYCSTHVVVQYISTVDGDIFTIDEFLVTMLSDEHLKTKIYFNKMFVKHLCSLISSLVHGYNKNETKFSISKVFTQRRRSKTKSGGAQEMYVIKKLLTNGANNS